jgi:predicted amidophosphoribosyltransferase
VTRLSSDDKGKYNAILFDDVLYFGATSEACARKLLQAGFARVYAIFLGENQP